MSMQDRADVASLTARTAAWLPALNRILRAAVIALSAFFVLLFLYTALRRMHYPFDLEWVESGILVSVARIVHHQPLYTAPSMDYIPYLYAPLYFYVCAFVAKFTGISFFTLRLVSTLSALGSLAILFAFVYRETRDWFAAIATVGVFVSLYSFIGAWFDIGRVDSLFVFLFLLALYCTRFAHPIVAAIVWTLAFQTKQSAIPIAILFLLTYWERERKSRVVIGLTTFAVLAWSSIHLIDHANGGWYNFYVFGATKGLPPVMRMGALYIPEVVLAPLAVALLVIAASAVLVPSSLKSRTARFYLIGSFTTFMAFWYVHWHRGVGNSMQVLYAWIALMLGIALHRIMSALAKPESPLQAWTPRLQALLLLAVCIQLASQIYNPGQYIPPASQREAREALIAQVQQIPGDVYIVNHSFDDVLANKQPHAEGEAIGAIIDAFPGTWRERVIDQLHTDAVQHRYSAIVLDGYYKDWLKPDTLAEYPVIVPAAGSDAGTYLTSQPPIVLLPCSAVTDGTAQRIVPEGHVMDARACASVTK